MKKNTPDIRADQPVEPKPETYDVSRYTTEVFRMFTTDEVRDETSSLKEVKERK